MADETDKDSIPGRVSIEKTAVQRVSNLRNSRETDFDSVVMTAWLGTSWMDHEAKPIQHDHRPALNHYPQSQAKSLSIIRVARDLP